jgi:hypothetical protein
VSKVSRENLVGCPFKGIGMSFIGEYITIIVKYIMTNEYEGMWNEAIA